MTKKQRRDKESSAGHRTKSVEENRPLKAQAGSTLCRRGYRELNTALNAAKSGEQG
jgi:hypothetical protein